MSGPEAGAVAALVDALLGPDPRRALPGLALGDPVLEAVRAQALRRLGPVALEPGGPAARLLLAVSGHPGRSAAELAGLAGLDDGQVRAAGAELLAAGLVTDARFGKRDVWTRTADGARALVRLRAQEP